MRQASIHFARGIMIPIAHQMAGNRLAVRKQFPQKRATEQENRQRVKRAAGILKRAVWIRQLSPDDSGVMRFSHERQQAVDRAGFDLNIGVQDENIFRIEFADRLIDGFRIPFVRLVAEQRDGQ